MPKSRWITLIALLFIWLAPPVFGDSMASARGKTKAVAEKSKKKAYAKRKKKRGRRGKFMGHAVAKSSLRTEPMPVPSGRIVVSSPALKENLDLNIYLPDGSFDQAALAKLDHLMRCRKTHEERAADPRLYVVLSLLYDKYGKPIELNSGFRYQRNEGSRHFHASAMDVTIPGVHWREVYEFAESLDGGGMGIGRYPRSGFVHIDFRAPGEPSYRWTDTHGSGGNDPGKQPSQMWTRSKRPNT
jgi:uncharacterized protein YcbK (DUF882 family)